MATDDKILKALEGIEKHLASLVKLERDKQFRDKYNRPESTGANTYIQKQQGEN